jgi:hypothetical protein
MSSPAVLRRMYKERLEQGLCTRPGCPDKQETGKSMCRRHLDVKNEYEQVSRKKYLAGQRLKRTKKLEQGLCTYHGCPAEHEAGKSMCQQHLDEMKARAHARRSKDIVVGTCQKCRKNPIVEGRTSCRQCLRMYRERSSAARFAER